MSFWISSLAWCQKKFSEAAASAHSRLYLLDMPQLLYDLDWSEHARALVQLLLLKSEELVLNQLFLLSAETKNDHHAP